MAERLAGNTLSQQARALLPYLIDLLGGATARAGNADTVDNLHASTTPTGGQLLALDGTGKFPASVLPVFADAQFLTLATHASLANERRLVAGAGLALADGGANGDATLSVNASNGLAISGDDVILASSAAGAGLGYAAGVLAIGQGDGITVNADTIEVAAGDGLTLDAIEHTVKLASTVAGAGLTYSGGILDVGASDTSVTINANGIQVRLATTSGLQVSSGLLIGAGDTSITVNANSIQVRLATTSGLAVSTGLLIADTIAGAGLTIASKVLAVASGNAGIVVSADAITLTLPTPSGLEIVAGGLQVADALAGAGLTMTSKVLAVGAGLGITVNADDVALTTPGTLTGGTTNSSSGNHTHAITTGNAAANSANLAAPSSSGTAIALAAHTHSIDQGIIPTWTGQHTFQANPVFSTGGDPVFYLATSGTTYRFIQVLTSLTSGSASGIKVGGLLAASDYNYASPTAGNAVIQGTLGINTTNPAYLLDVNGTGRFSGGLNLGTATGAATGEVRTSAATMIANSYGTVKAHTITINRGSWNNIEAARGIYLIAVGNQYSFWLAHGNAGSVDTINKLGGSVYHVAGAPGTDWYIGFQAAGGYLQMQPYNGGWGATVSVNVLRLSAEW